ncbi:hypothetical protein P4V43_12240 [Brevibacillus fortis]|uniref:hypothetical protein n=1 Tax=Brevibacillus fortis TaxID=2126352 RepID=UPI002E1E8AE9|nr:hypothetical protein [Brevibacillus fortis]
MKMFIVEPRKGIGQITLGMTRDEVRKYAEVNDLRLFNPRKDSSAVQWVGDIKVEYDSDDRVNFIELSSYKGNDDFTCLLMGIDVFETKAENLAEQIDKVSPYDRDHWELGYMYIYHELGLAFWRPVVFKDEYMQEEWFLAHDKKEQESYLKDQYFSTVTIAVDGYWK